MLEGANIKLSGTITDINGKSTRNILETILGGTRIDDEINHHMTPEEKKQSSQSKTLQESLIRVLKLSLQSLKQI